MMEKIVLREVGSESDRKTRHKQLSQTVETSLHRCSHQSRRYWISLLYLFLPPLLLFACAPAPEKSKALVKIANVTLSRLDEQTLRVTFDYDLEPGVKLPLPYKGVLISPLEPGAKLAGQLPEFVLSNGSVAINLEIPSDAGFDWKDLETKDACCIVSLKGMQEEPGTHTPFYERISNSVQVALPQISG